MENQEFIEVVGEGEYQEEVEKNVAEIIFEVRATKEETALNEVADLKDRCVKDLLKAGLLQSEIFDGGSDLTRPWMKRKNVGKEASYKIMVHTKNFGVLSKALQYIDCVPTSQRETILINMKQPIFRASPLAQQQAMTKAIESAREKAEILAKEAKVTLGKVIRIEELSKAKRSSGSYGDEDWGGDYGRFAAAGAVAEEDTIDLSLPKRSIWLYFRVRFAISS